MPFNWQHAAHIHCLFLLSTVADGFECSSWAGRIFGGIESAATPALGRMPKLTIIYVVNASDTYDISTPKSLGQVHVANHDEYALHVIAHTCLLY